MTKDETVALQTLMMFAQKKLMKIQPIDFSIGAKIRQIQLQRLVEKRGESRRPIKCATYLLAFFAVTLDDLFERLSEIFVQLLHAIHVFSDVIHHADRLFQFEDLRRH